MEKGQCLQQTVLGKLGIYMNEVKPLSYTMHKNQLKMDKHLNVRPGSVKLLRENRGTV